MKMKLLLMLVLVALFATACGGAQGDLYKASKVKKAVKNHVPSENYKLESVETVPDAEVSTEIYTFKSKERDLTFTAVNTRAVVMFNTNVYGKALYINYVDDVHALYEADAKQILDKYGIEQKNANLVVNSYSDLDKLTKALTEIDDLYKGEKKYNSEEWMKEHPLHNYPVDYSPIIPDGKSKYYDVCYAPINGSWNYDTLYEFLSFSYASRIKEQKFEDPSVTPEILAKGHIGLIHDYYINGVNIPKSAYEGAFSRNLTNNSERMYDAGYCYALSDYIIPLNVGLTDENYAPQIMEAIFGALSIDNYNVEYKKGVITWSYNGDSWKVEASQNKDSLITSVKFTKNGRNYDIPYLNYEDWSSPVHGTYIIGIRVSDFVDMFDLNVTIDEENGVITFNPNA